MTILDEILAGAPPDMMVARRIARRAELDAQRVEHEALMSGAFPADFKVVHLFRIGRPWGTRLG
jgi:hypothetical protein